MKKIKLSALAVLLGVGAAAAATVFAPNYYIKQADGSFVKLGPSYDPTKCLDAVNPFCLYQINSDAQTLPAGTQATGIEANKVYVP